MRRPAAPSHGRPPSPPAVSPRPWRRGSSAGRSQTESVRHVKTREYRGVGVRLLGGTDCRGEAGGPYMDGEKCSWTSMRVRPVESRLSGAASPRVGNRTLRTSDRRPRQRFTARMARPGGYGFSVLWMTRFAINGLRTAGGACYAPKSVCYSRDGGFRCLWM